MINDTVAQRTRSRYINAMTDMKRMRNRPLNERLASIERKIAGHHAKLETLYHRVYATIRRRGEAYEKQVARVRAFNKTVSKSTGNLRRVGKIVGAMSRNRMLMTFTPQQRCRLQFLLRPRLSGAQKIKGPSGTVAVMLSPRYVSVLRRLLRKESK